MECNEKSRVSKLKDTERDYLKEFQESDQNSNDYPIKNTHNITTSFVNSESKDEFKLGVSGKMFSNSDGSQKDLKMKESNGHPISNNLKNKLSNLNKKFFSLKIKEKFEASSSTENSESKDVGKDEKSINDCAEISAKLSFLSLTKRKEDYRSKTHEETHHSKYKGLSEQSSEGSQVLSNDASERDSKMKENISNAKSEEPLENIESKVDEDTVDLANVENDKNLHFLEDIILGLEKTHLTERGGPDRTEKRYVRCRPRPTLILSEADIAFLNRTGFRRNDPPIVLNQEENLGLIANSFGHNQSFSPSFRTNYQGDYSSTSISQTNILPPNSSEPVNIDEITPTLSSQYFPSDSSFSSHLVTESLVLSSEIPQDASWDSFSTGNEIGSSLIQKTPHFSRSSSTRDESQYTESPLNLFQGETFLDVSEDIPKRHSKSTSSFQDQSSEGLNYLPDYESDAEVLSGSEDNPSEVVNIDEILPSLSLQNFSPDSSLNSLATGLELFSEIPQDTLWHSFLTDDGIGSSLTQTPRISRSSSTIAESQNAESSLDLFQSENFANVSEYIPKRHSSTSSFPDQSSEGSNYLPYYEGEAVVPCGSFETNYESLLNDLEFPVMSGNDTEKFFKSLSKSSLRNYSEQYRTAQFQHETLENQPQVRQSDEFKNARTGYTSNEVTSQTIFQQSSSPHQNERRNSPISSTFSDLNPFIQSSLSSKITSLTKTTLKEPSYISTEQNTSDAHPSKYSSFSQIRYKPPVKEPFRCLDNNQTISNSLRPNFNRVSNLQPAENQSKWISNPSKMSSSRGGIQPITCAVKSFYQNKLMNTPIFKEKYQNECTRFEREIQEENLGTNEKKIIHYMKKNNKTKYRGTNLHAALKNRNVVRFYIIVEKYKEYHQNTSDVNIRDSDGKTVYDIAKKFMEEDIEFMDLVVKYLEENYAVEGIAKPKEDRKKKDKL